MRLASRGWEGLAASVTQFTCTALLYKIMQASSEIGSPIGTSECYFATLPTLPETASYSHAAWHSAEA